MKRKGGTRRKSRNKFTKSSRTKGKIDITAYLRQYNEGDRVTLSLEPSIHEGAYHPRFKGRSGRITAEKGSCYEVEIKDGGKTKHIITHPVHLKPHE
jgi:large subunit ribosomal protein L21e